MTAFDGSDVLLFIALFCTGLGGAIGTAAVVVWLRNAFRQELANAWAKMDRERSEWQARERTYLERIARLEVVVATLSERLDRVGAPAVTINAGQNANVGGDVTGRDHTS